MAKKGISLVILLGLVLGMGLGPAFALPEGESVVSGTAEFSQPDDNTLHITTSDKVIINYQGFNIASPETVQFFQPSASSVALSRVIGVNPSEIFGKLLANGRIFLINPNGIFFGPSSQIDTASFLASTLDIKNEDFLNDKLEFFLKPGTEGSSIINQGSINAASGGFVALLSPKVINQGVISANKGKIVLASAEKITLDFDGDGLIKFAVEGEVADGLIENKGRITANAGEVLLAVNAAKSIIENVINNEGVIEANSIDTKNGVIRLIANQRVNIAGLIEAKGGEVIVESEGADFSGTINCAKGTYNMNGGDTNISGNYSGDQSWSDSANIIINGDVTVTANNVTISMFADHNSTNPGDWHDGTGTITRSGDSTVKADTGVTGSSLNLKAGSGIGEVATPIQTNIHTLNAQVGGTGGIYISQGATAITLEDIDTANGAVTITSGGNMITDGLILPTSGNLTLDATGSFTQSYGLIKTYTSGDIDISGSSVTLGAVESAGALTVTADSGNITIASTDGYENAIVVDHEKVGPKDDLGSDAASGQANVVVTDAKKFAVDQTVLIKEDSNEETFTIALIDTGTNTLTMSGNLVNSYTTAASAYVEGIDDQNNFPVLVKLTNTNLDFTLAETNGHDIRFVDSNGNLLSYEREYWSQGSSLAYVWVKLPTLSGSSNTSFTMYHGNTDATTDGEQATAVWDSNYKMVQHMTGAAYTDLDDSTSNSNDVSAQGGDPAYNQTGRVYNAVTFDGGDYVEVSDSDSLDISSQITLSAWVKAAAFTNKFAKIIMKSVPVPTSEPWELYTLGFGGYKQRPVFIISTGQSGGHHILTNPTDLSTGEWYHIVGTYDGSTMRLYINGVVTKTNDVEITIGTNNEVLRIGKTTYPGMGGFNGTIDEVMISDTARDADWIKTEYNNQYNPLATGDDPFYNILSTSSAVSSGLSSNNQNIAINGNVVIDEGVTAILDTGSAGAGNISITGTIDGTANLILNGGTGGDIILTDAVGGTTPLTNLSITNVNNLDLQAVTLTGNMTQSAGSGTTTFNGLVSTGGDVNVTTGIITFAGAGSVNASAGANDVTLTAETGAITSGAATTDITANTLIFSAVTGIGSSDAIETEVSNLQARNTSSGNINISNAGSLGLKDSSGWGFSVRAYSGNIDISTGLDMTIEDVVKASGSVELKASTGSILDDGDGATDVIAGADSTLWANGVIGRLNDALDVNISPGNLFIYSNGSLDGVSVNIWGTVLPSENLSLLNVPPGLVLFSNKDQKGSAISQYSRGELSAAAMIEGLVANRALLRKRLSPLMERGVNLWAWELVNAKLTPETEIMQDLYYYLELAEEFHKEGEFKKAKKLYEIVARIAKMKYNKAQDYVMCRIELERELKSYDALARSYYRKGELHKAKKWWQKIIITEARVEELEL